MLGFVKILLCHFKMNPHEAMRLYGNSRSICDFLFNKISLLIKVT